jgi:hypothetical protein
MTDIAARIVSAVLVVAIMFVLVRPGSDAGTAVTDVSGALKDIVSSVVR